MFDLNSIPRGDNYNAVVSIIDPGLLTSFNVFTSIPFIIVIGIIALCFLLYSGKMIFNRFLLSRTEAGLMVVMDMRRDGYEIKLPSARPPLIAGILLSLILSFSIYCRFM